MNGGFLKSAPNSIDYKDTHKRDPQFSETAIAESERLRRRCPLSRFLPARSKLGQGFP